MGITFLYNSLNYMYQRALLGENKPIKYVIAAVLNQCKREADLALKRKQGEGFKNQF